MLCQNPLQRAPVYIEPARGFRHVASAQFTNALDVLSTQAVGRYRVFIIPRQDQIGKSKSKPK